MNNDFGSRVKRFSSYEVTSENNWQTASRVTQKSLFTVTNVLSYFLQAILCSEHTIPLNQLSIADFAIVAEDGIDDLALWRHHSWSVTSCERGVLPLWCHIRWLFLHAQIGAKAIFINE